MPAPTAPPLVAGIGCRAGVQADELIALVVASLEEAGDSAGRIAAIATLDSKADHPAIIAAAAHFGVPVVPLSEEALSTAIAPTPSAKVREKTGLESIAEAAVLATGKLLIEKRKSANATCAIGQLRAGGH